MPKQFSLPAIPDDARQGQRRAIPALAHHFTEHDRGKLLMTGGAGKSRAAGVYIEHRQDDVTVVFTPWIHLVKQFLKEYRQWFPESNAQFMCVCSESDPTPDFPPEVKAKLADAAANSSAQEYAALVEEVKNSGGKAKITTDPNQIAAFLKRRGRKVIFSTFDSSPAYGRGQELADVIANFGVFDEAQWTASGGRETSASHALLDKNVAIKQRLFMTGTERHYTRAGHKVYSMDNVEMYGPPVLVDEDGNDDPWTLRHAIEAKEAPTYRIVISFVTDPAYNPKLAQSAPYRQLLQGLGENSADPEEVLLRVGQAMALEDVKARFGAQKPLGFFRSVATARLFADVLNAAKSNPRYFPRLAQGAQAISISSYDKPQDREKAMEHFHTEPQTEITNARLFIFGTDVPSVDTIFFGDPIASKHDVVQASGRAFRYVEGKIATLVIPVMLPYPGDNLEAYAKQLPIEMLREACGPMIDMLDSLCEMDPILRHEMHYGGSGTGNDTEHPPIIQFTFPRELLPTIRDAITTAVWREINPETDFIDNLKCDRAALDKYRMEQFPTQADPVKEAEFAVERAKTRIIPFGNPSYKTHASRMWNLRKAVREYYNAGKKDGMYGTYAITQIRGQHILSIYGWDEAFVMQDNFEAQLREDRAVLDRYRLECFPTQKDPAKEAEYAEKRAEIRIISRGTSLFKTEARRMSDHRRALKAYYESGEKKGKYVNHIINPDRAKHILQIYGWDKAYVMQDDFEAQLREDRAVLDRYRLECFPVQKDPAKEADFVARRAEIKIIPSTRHSSEYKTTAVRMANLRNALRGFYESNKEEGSYNSYALNSAREKHILQIYGWDKAYVMQDDFEAQLREDRAVLDRYRLECFPVQKDPAKERGYAAERKKISIIPKRATNYQSTAARMYNLRLSIKSYYESDNKDGRHGNYLIDAERAKQILRIYGWDKAFVMQDDFEAQLREDRAVLDRYRLECFPTQKDRTKEEEFAAKRQEIRIIPGGKPGYTSVASRMYNLRRDINARMNGQETRSYKLTDETMQLVLDIYGWDEAFVRGEGRSAPARKGRRVNKYHILPRNHDMFGTPPRHTHQPPRRYADFFPV